MRNVCHIVGLICYKHYHNVTARHCNGFAAVAAFRCVMPPRYDGKRKRQYRPSSKDRSLVLHHCDRNCRGRGSSSVEGLISAISSRTRSPAIGLGGPYNVLPPQPTLTDRP